MARIKRGQVWIANIDPGFESEIRKKRPVLIISNDTINAYWPKVIAVPITTKVFYPGVEKVSIGKEAGVKVDSELLATEIRSIDKKRLVEKAGKITKEKLFEVEAALRAVLGIEEIN
ncbi:MAG: type II toxin-antitoxin system PemK/MazF family toxin [Candidatus Blackburnbacteria bacterium]|nr:type II toxin-antitoxin system PemK/MazF family toxin [Candidatus Blackburnbacteria bacterium]